MFKNNKQCKFNAVRAIETQYIFNGLIENVKAERFNAFSKQHLKSTSNVISYSAIEFALQYIPNDFALPQCFIKTCIKSTCCLIQQICNCQNCLYDCANTVYWCSCAQKAWCLLWRAGIQVKFATVTTQRKLVTSLPPRGRNPCIINATEKKGACISFLGPSLKK